MTYTSIVQVCAACIVNCWMLLSNQTFALEHIVQSGMGGGDNGCDCGLLGVTSNNIPQTEKHVASFPGSCTGEEEREPGTHCSRMRQIPPAYYSATLKLRSISVYLLKGCTAWLYTLWDTYGRF